MLPLLASTLLRWRGMHPLELPSLWPVLLISWALGPRGLRNLSQGLGPPNGRIRLKGVIRGRSQPSPPGVRFRFVDSEDLLEAPES